MHAQHERRDAGEHAHQPEEQKRRDVPRLVVLGVVESIPVGGCRRPLCAHRSVVVAAVGIPTAFLDGEHIEDGCLTVSPAAESEGTNSEFVVWRSL